MIIRYEGPRGSGMPEMLMTTEAIVCDHKLNGKVSLITDGRFSGATRGAAIGHVSPGGSGRRADRLCGDRRISLHMMFMRKRSIS